MVINDLIKSSYTLLLIMPFLTAVSCGQRQRQVAPTKVSKPKAEPVTPVDNSANLVVPKKICVRENCPASNFTIILSGPMSSKVNGFIAEVAVPVNWQIQIKNDDGRRMAVFPDNTATIHPITGAYVNGLTAQTSQTQSGTVPQTTGFIPGTSSSSSSSVGNQIGQLQAFDAFKVNWPNPPKLEDKITFTVRDISRCEVRSKDGAQALCQQFDQPSIVDQSIDVPIKIDNGILGQAKDEHTLLEKLAGCLAVGALGQAGLDPTEGAIVKGVIKGFTGGNTNCNGATQGVGTTSSF